MATCDDEQFKELKKATNFGQNDFNYLHRIFTEVTGQSCVLTRKEFIKWFRKTPKEEGADEMTLYCFLDNVFTSFDNVSNENKQGCLTFKQFMMALDRLCNGSEEGILNAIFDVCDVTSRKYVEKHDIRTLFQSLSFVQDSTNNIGLETLVDFTDTIFHDKDSLSRSEFIKIIRNHPKQEELIIRAVRLCFF